MSLIQGCQEKGGKDKAMAVWSDVGTDLFHFLALYVTLMKEFGS